VTAVPAAVAGDPPRERGVVAAYRRLYYGRTRFDFVRRKRIWFLVSGLVILASVVSLGVRGLNFDIEFVGGTSWTVPANGATVSEARAAIAPLGFSGASITLLGTGSHQNLQVEAKLGNSRHPTSGPTVNKISQALARITHHSSVAAVSVEQVGPTWGSQITHKALIALVVFFIMIAIYISIFFEWKMALAAILAVLHDIAVTVGIYSLSGFLVTPDTVVAFLTILGYSLYDTIVVFDRIRDNTKGLGASGKLTFTDVVNLSMNQTLARSINTSLVAILPILSVLVLGANFLGASTLQYFGLALLVGLTSGAYSSIFIASPIVAVLKERESRWTQIRRRLEGRGGTVMLLTPAAVASGALDEREPATASRSRRGRGAARPERREPLRPGVARELHGNGAREQGEPERSDEEEALFEQDEAVGAEAAAAAGAAPAVSSSGRPPSGAARPGKSQGGAGRSGPAPRPRKRRRR
jgi:preprotein translocase subunit SecF